MIVQAPTPIRRCAPRIRRNRAQSAAAARARPLPRRRRRSWPTRRTTARAPPAGCRIPRAAHAARWGAGRCAWASRSHARSSSTGAGASSGAAGTVSRAAVVMLKFSYSETQKGSSSGRACVHATRRRPGPAALNRQDSAAYLPYPGTRPQPGRMADFRAPQLRADNPKHGSTQNSSTTRTSG